MDYCSNPGQFTNNQKQITEISIRDIDPLRKDEFFEKLEKIIQDSCIIFTIKDANDAFKDFKKEDGTSYTFKDLKKAAKERCLSQTKSDADKIIRFRKKEIMEGVPFFKAYEKIFTSSLEVYHNDFATPLNAKINDLNKSDTELSFALKQRRVKKSLIKDINKTNEFYNKEFTYLNTDIQIQWFQIVASKLNKQMHELTNDELDINKDIFLDLVKKHEEHQYTQNSASFISQLDAEKKKATNLNKKRLKRQKKKEKINQRTESSKEPSKTTPPASQSVCTATTQITTQLQDPFKEDICLLNKSSSNVSKVHSRIKRWDISNDKLHEIRNFTDRDENGKVIYPYAEKNDSQLRELKENHNLIGLLKLLTLPQFIEKYSSPYYYKDAKGMHTGLAFQVKKSTKAKKEGEVGMIHVGIGEKEERYHATFKPFSSPRIQPIELISKFSSSLDDKMLIDEHLTIPCVYDILDNGHVLLKIGKNPNSRVIYEFKPFKR